MKALSAAQRQELRRIKLRANGKVLFQAWVTPAQAKKIKTLLNGEPRMDDTAVTYHAPAPSETKRRVRRREKPKAKGRVSRPFVPLTQLKGLSKETLAFLEKKEIKALVKRIDTPEAERQARGRLSKRTEA